MRNFGERKIANGRRGRKKKKGEGGKEKREIALGREKKKGGKRRKGAGSHPVRYRDGVARCTSYRPGGEKKGKKARRFVGRALGGEKGKRSVPSFNRHPGRLALRVSSHFFERERERGKHR